MKPFNLHHSLAGRLINLLFVTLILSFRIGHAQNAPISTVGEEATTGIEVTVPITAVNFSDIGSCNLQLLYNPSITVCTDIALGPGMNGTISYNILTPGVITIGWYTWPGITLANNSIIFNLTFEKINSGTSAITWNDSYSDRQWSNGNSMVLNDLPLEEYYFPGSVTFQEDAPLTYAPILTGCPNYTLDIPVTVENFNTIGALSLTLHFDNAVLTYQSFTNNSGFPGLNILNPNPGVVTAAGFSSSTGISLDNNSVLFTLHFLYLGGECELSWYDNGSSCEYAGPPTLYSALIDTPQSTYYIDGSVSQNMSTNWTGNLDTDWLKSDNWDCDVPVSTSNVMIDLSPKGMNPKLNYPVISTDVEVNSITINPGSSLTLNPTATLKVTSTLTNNSSSDNLVLKSDANSTASLLHFNNDVEATIQRYILASQSNPIDPVYHLVSVPLTQSSNPLSGLFMWSYLFAFDATTQAWVALGIPTNTPLFVDQGYMIYKYPGPENWQPDTTYSFAGPMNNGTFTCNVIYDEEYGNNHNLVPNPYPSAIDWNAGGWTKINVYDAVWIWNPANGNYATYGSDVGINGGTQYIPVGQSFFISTSSDNPVLEMNNNVRVHNSQPFFKQTEEIVDLLRIKAEANGFADELVIRFKEGATPSFDGEFDVTKLYGNASAPQLFSVSEDDKTLCINSIPESSESIAVPVGFSLNTAGLYTLFAGSLSSFSPGTEIHLHDLLNGNIVDLNQNPEYSFTHDPDNEPIRFKIVFNGSTTIVESELQEAYYYYADRKLFMNFPNDIKAKFDINIVNVHGQTFFHTQTNNGKSVIELYDLNQGFYVASISCKNGVFTKKFIVK